MKNLVLSCLVLSCSLIPTFLNAQFNVGSNDVSFTSAQQTKLSAHFNDYSAIHLATKELHNHLKNQSAPASIALMVGDSIWQLQLEENEIRSSDMLIMRTTSSGDFIQQKGDCNTYKGIVNGDTNQITRLFINERIISGYFFSYGKQFEIAPAQEFLQEPFDPSLQETYIVFESKDRIGEPDFICLTNIDTSTLSGPFDDDLDWRTDCDAFNENWDNNPPQTSFPKYHHAMKIFTKDFKIIYLFFFILINNISAQPPEIAWQLSLGDTFDDFAFKMIPTKDQGFLILSSTVPLTDTLLGFDGGDIKIYKLDKDRNVEWSKVWRGHNTEKPIDVCQTEDGFLVTAYSNSSDQDFQENYGLEDIWILKIADNGDLLWKKNYGGSGQDSPQKIIATSDHRFTVIATTNSHDRDVQNYYGNVDTWLFEINYYGEILRSKNFGGSKGDQLNDALLLDNGNLILVGSSSSSDFDVPQNSGEADGWVLELDKEWNILTTRTYGGSRVDLFSSIDIETDGFIIGGTTYSENAGMPSNPGLALSNVWLLKLNDYGNKEWSKIYGGSRLEYTSKVEFFNNQIILFGGTHSNDGDIRSQIEFGAAFWVILFDKNGNIIWEKTLGGSEGESGRDFLVNEKGEILLLGETESKDGDLPPTLNLPYNKNVWLVGLTSIFPNILANSCNDFILAPNPIAYDQPLQFHFPESVSLSAQLDYFDTMGKKIGATQLVELIGQNPEVDLPKQLVSGTYFLKIATSQEVCTQKIVVVNN